MENVRVLAVDQMLDNPENKALLAKTVTLEVQPRQAEAINVALEMGKISLALRSLAVDDATQAAQAPAPAVETDAVKLEDFYPDTAAPTASDRHYTRDSDISRLLGGNGSSSQMMRVRVIRGETSSELEFRPPAQ